MVGVQVTEQDGGDYTVSFANGLTLVQGNNTYQMSAVPSSSDPTRRTLGYNYVQGASEVPEAQISRGILNGVLKFRSETLDGTRNQLGQIAAVAMWWITLTTPLTPRCPCPIAILRR